MLAGAAGLLGLGLPTISAQQGPPPERPGEGDAPRPSVLLAQAPQLRSATQPPTPSAPTAAPSPAASPSPAPGPTASPKPVRDPNEHINYRAQRLPQQARINVAAVGALPAAATQFLAPDPLTGIYDPVRLPAVAGQPPAPVTVSLTFDYAQHADKVVFVQALDGGTIEGNPGGRPFTLDHDGLLTFTFQAPARPRPYQISVRLDNVETGLRFTVFNPAGATGR